MQNKYRRTITLSLLFFNLSLLSNRYISRFANSITSLKSYHRKDAQKELFKLVRIQRPSDIETLYATIHALEIGSTFPIISIHADTLKKSLEHFSETEGIVTKIYELLGSTDTVRFFDGHIYELEKALAIYERNDGEHIEAFSAPLYCYKKRKFRVMDIITNRRFIECKNIDWNYVPADKDWNAVCKLRKQFLNEQALAHIENERTNGKKQFIVASKKAITLGWQAWFKEHSIAYEEDA